MIRYELKDKEHQAALEKALPGFSEELQARCAWAFEDEENYVGVSHCDGVQHPGFYWEVDVPKEQIEVIGKYDSKKWNKFPEVTPPEGVWMRVEGDRARGFHVKHGAIFLRGEWYWRIPQPSDPSPACAQIDRREVERFRPWDEGEGES